MPSALKPVSHLKKQIDVNDERLVLHYSDLHNGLPPRAAHERQMTSEPTLLKIELSCSLFLANTIQEFGVHKRSVVRSGLQVGGLIASEAVSVSPARHL
jgi:hypothetical protein